MLIQESSKQIRTTNKKMKATTIKSLLLILLGIGVGTGYGTLKDKLPQISLDRTDDNPSETVTTETTTDNAPKADTTTITPKSQPVSTSLDVGSAESVADVVEVVGAAVVTIDTTRRSANNFQDFGKEESFGRGFEDFFEGYPDRQFREPQRRPQRQAPRSSGTGSGFIINGEGHIITNAHVIQDADEVRVTLRDGRSFAGQVLGSDPMTDLAVIKIDAEGLPNLKLADSDRLRVGEATIAIGNPLGLDSTVTTGIVSATGRSSGEVGVPDRRLEFIQTDAAINPGNSGGPLLNSRGEVIGINTAIMRNAQGLGFAIPSNIAQRVTSQLIATGEVAHPYLGVQMVTLNAVVQEELGLYDLEESAQGVAIVRVMPNSPAAEARLRERDIITKVGGEAITTASDLQRLVAAVDVGDELALEVLREGRKLELTVVTAKLPATVARR